MTMSFYQKSWEVMKSWIEDCTYDKVFGMDADLEFCYGFEIPKATSKEARQALKQLKKDGIICVYYGPSLRNRAYLVARELYVIAGYLGFDFFFPERDAYRFVVLCDNQRYRVS